MHSLSRLTELVQAVPGRVESAHEATVCIAVLTTKTYTHTRTASDSDL